MLYRVVISISLFFTTNYIFAQDIIFERADSLMGNHSNERKWWDVTHYDLHARFDPENKTISGKNITSYKVLSPYQTMQIDLQIPMILDSVIQNKQKCKWTQEDDAYFVQLTNKQIVGEMNEVTFYFHGSPKVAKMPPWQGGMIWQKDNNKNPWMSIACQGMAASVWFPNKDHMYDEPDSVAMSITAPENLVTVAGGRLRSIKTNPDATKTYHWAVVNPINNYNIIPYIGKYVNIQDTFHGEGGVLDINYWVLDYNKEKATEHFKQTKSMLRCFESWFGKYPFYEDGYKLVESPHLGMEHQSAIAYGNRFNQGYMGRDLSGTGWGLKWDFIIVHESGHEWFGNNISARDVADNWIHEGFTAYSENLYTEYLFGKTAGAEYVVGTRKAVINDKPTIGPYGVNKNGSGDMYYKAANMLHTIRQMVNDDVKWKAFLRDVNKTFWHKTTDTREVETYMSNYLGINLQKVFDQYLRTTEIPVLEYVQDKKKLKYRWSNSIDGFDMPVDVISQGQKIKIKPSEKWQTLKLKTADKIEIDKNYYVIQDLQSM